MVASRFSDVRPETRSQFLDGLAPADRKTVLGAAIARRFATNSVIANQGHYADHLYLLTKGRARNVSVTKDGKKLLLIWLRPGDMFGVQALLSSRLSYLISTAKRS